MQNSLIKFRVEFESLVLRFLWRQWSALGVSGYTRSDNNWIIDPEALLLFSTEMARSDPRLFDEILDWLDGNANRLSIQRITRMRKEYELGDASILAAIASILSERSEHAKWVVLARNANPASVPHRELFPRIPVIGEPDPHFLKWGWKRSLRQSRGLGHPPRPDQTATFLFKLRSLFGRQSRAEIIAWLLANDAGHPAEIARQTGYFKRSVQTALNELEESGHIHSVKIGREKRFTLRHDEWRFLITWNHGKDTANDFPIWIHWPPLLQTFSCLHQLLCNPKFEDMSEKMQSIEIKRSIDFSLLSKSGLPAHFSRTPSTADSAFLNTLLAELTQFLE